MDIMTIIYFLLILGIILIVHEVGHLLTAKYFGVYCREFSIGLGPVIYQKQGKETKWSLRLIPIGGYVAMAGDVDSEDKKDEESDDESELVIPANRTLPGIAKWKQAIIMFAGSFMNILLAFIVFVIVIFSQGKGMITPTLEAVIPNSPTMYAGLQSGDIVVEAKTSTEKVEVTKNSDVNKLSQFLSDNIDGVTLVVNRDGKLIEAEIIPEFNKENQRYMIGIQYASDNSFGGKMASAFALFTANATAIISAIFNLFKGQGLENLGGPVGILTMTSNVAKSGFMNLVMLLGSLSINVGLFNLIPIPMFDGGRIVILTIEAILGKDLNTKTKERLMYIGLFLILGIFVLATWNDIARIFFK